MNVSSHNAVLYNTAAHVYQVKMHVACSLLHACCYGANCIVTP